MGKLVSEISIKYEGDFFDLCLKPYKFSEIVPHKIESVDLVAGRWGTVGSVISWTYIIGGAKSVAKEIIEGIDEKSEKKSMTIKVIGGDILNLYSEFKIIYEVKSSNTNGQHDLTYTMEYEKKSDQIQVPQPTIFMDFLLNLSTDIERALRLLPN